MADTVRLVSPRGVEVEVDADLASRLTGYSPVEKPSAKKAPAKKADPAPLPEDA